MNRSEIMVKISDHALTFSKDELYKFVFEMSKWIPDMGLWSFAEDVLPKEKEVKS